MATTITIEITPDEAGEYTYREALVLAALNGPNSEEAPARRTRVKEAPAEEAPAEEAPAEEAPARRTRRTKAQIEADKAAEEAKAEEPAEEKTLQEELDEDLLGGDAEPEYTVQDAVKLATKMVSDGKSAEVKAALATAGAPKVSGLKGAAIATFINALEG